MVCCSKDFLKLFRGHAHVASLLLLLLLLHLLPFSSVLLESSWHLGAGAGADRQLLLPRLRRQFRCC